MRARILSLLRQSPDAYVSGEEISKLLDVSRTAIWKHIQTLKQEGYEIESHSRLGYRLCQAPDLLLPGEVQPALTTGLIGQAIHYFPSLDSTNNEAKKLAYGGCPEGTIVIAEEQNTGRGRMSRGWFSPFGKGVWLSVVLRPKFAPQEAAKCTLLAAVAAVRAIKRVTALDCGIKWPNDIFFQGRKLVGILTEMSAEMDAINYIVIGMGINVNIVNEDFPAELREIATSLAIAGGKPVSRLHVLTAVLEELEALYTVANEQGFSPILDEWRLLSVTLGQVVDVYGIGRSFFGKALDIDADGALLVQTEDTIEKVLAGDVSIRARL